MNTASEILAKLSGQNVAGFRPFGVRHFDTFIAADEWLRATGHFHMGGDGKLSHVYARNGEARWSMKLSKNYLTGKFEVTEADTTPAEQKR